MTKALHDEEDPFGEMRTSSRRKIWALLILVAVALASVGAVLVYSDCREKAKKREACTQAKKDAKVAWARVKADALAQVEAGRIGHGGVTGRTTWMDVARMAGTAEAAAEGPAIQAKQAADKAFSIGNYQLIQIAMDESEQSYRLCQDLEP